MVTYIQRIVLSKRYLFVLFIVNLLGTIYDFIWYKHKLAITQPIFIPFVPVSPTESLSSIIFLFFFIWNVNVPYIEALAIVTLFKYGVWAVVMNGLTWLTAGSLGWEGYMLILSHGAMAIQGLLYAPFYK